MQVNPLIFLSGEGVKALCVTFRVCARTRAYGDFRHICLHPFTPSPAKSFKMLGAILSFILTSLALHPVVSSSSFRSCNKISKPRSQLPLLVCLTTAFVRLACRRCTNPFTAGMVLSRNPLASAHSLNMP